MAMPPNPQEGGGDVVSAGISKDAFMKKAPRGESGFLNKDFPEKSTAWIATAAGKRCTDGHVISYNN